MTKKRNRRRSPWRQETRDKIEEIRKELALAIKERDGTWAESCRAQISMLEHMLIHDD
jgi:hypothetical protein